MSRIMPALALSLVASACASVPMASADLDRAAKELRTTPGQSNVYLFRDEAFGGAVKMPVLIDGRMFGDTAANTFLVTTVSPGPHALLSKTENDARLEFTAEAGKNVYVWQEVKMGLLNARSALHLVDEATARPRISTCNLAVSEPPAPAAPPPATPAQGAAAVPRS